MREKILEVLVSLFGDRGVDLQSVSDDDNLSDILGWDSMDIVDMILALERRWQLQLADDLPSRVTLAEILERAEAAMASAGGA